AGSGARGAPAQGDPRVSGAWRKPPPSCPATADGERDALGAGRWARAGASDLAQRPVQIRRPEARLRDDGFGLRSEPGLSRARFHAGGVGVDGRYLRTGAGAASLTA